MSRRLLAIVALALGVVFASSETVFAQTSTPVLDLSSAVANTTTAAVVNAEQLPVQRVSFVPEFSRPRTSTAILASLYVSTAAMQALDVHSTLRALDAGAVEGNPLMSSVTKNRAAFIGVKAGVAASTILAARSLAKKNKVAAIVTLAAINSAYAMVVNHNFKVARGGR